MSKKPTRYAEVKRYVLDGIGNRSWGAGERVPSENELVDLCKVSRMTARRALQDLLFEGTLIRIKGKGSFVSDEKQQVSLMQITNIASEIRDQGQSHSSRLLSLEITSAKFEIAQAMNIDVGFQVFQSRVIHYQNERPIQLEYRWVMPDTAKNYINQSFKNQTPGEYLTEIAPVTEAEHKIEAIIGDPNTRELLEVEQLEAIILLNRKTWCDGQLVSFAKLYHPGDRYSFGTKFYTGAATLNR